MMTATQRDYCAECAGNLIEEGEPEFAEALRAALATIEEKTAKVVALEAQATAQNGAILDLDRQNTEQAAGLAEYCYVVREFCRQHAWGSQRWKEQPEIAALFRLAERDKGR